MREGSRSKADRLRCEIARVAAQLLFDEEARGYREARGQAVRQVSPGASVERGAHLPDYPEIHDALRDQLTFYGGDALARRNLEWRRLALEYLDFFAPFEPLLVGSVARGEVRELSDINLLLFCDKSEEVGYFLQREGCDYEEEGDADHACYFLEEEGIEISCRVRPTLERREAPRCRVTGKPQERFSAKRLRLLLDGATVPGERSPD